MRSVLVPAILCLAGSAAADAPFVPAGVNPPDYAVTTVWDDYGKAHRRTVTHHGEWTRVELGNDTEYFSANGAANIRIFGRGPSGSFERGRARLNYYDYEPRNTGERQTHLGESCTVWDIQRTKLDPIGYQFSHLSCITDDGVELWRKYVSRGRHATTSPEVRVERVERRPVAPDEVQPTRALLVLDWWNQNAPLGAQTVPDHEMVMELSEESPKAAKSIRTTRRLGPWEYVEETTDGTRSSLRIMHDSRRILLNYNSAGPDLPERLTIIRSDPAPAGDQTATAQAISMQPKDMDRAETVLGETCHWFDMMPRMADASRFACLTKDGIVLKDVISGQATRVQRWTAIHLTRRPVSLDEIKPPAELLEPQRWGID